MVEVGDFELREEKQEDEEWMESEVMVAGCGLMLVGGLSLRVVGDG